MLMNVNRWLKTYAQDLNGQVVAITGANGGIGSCLCRYLVQLHAKVIMLDRNVEKSNQVRETLLKEFPDAVIEVIALDLNRVQNVRDVVEQLSNRQIDFLVLNAGVYNVPLEPGELGYNNVFQVNFIAQYYLAKSLLPTLARCKGKIIATSSIVHRYYTTNPDDIDSAKDTKQMRVYGNAKRYLTFALAELLKKQTDVQLALVHPGLTATKMTNHYHPAINWLVVGGMKVLFPRPEKAALNLLAGFFQTPDNDEWLGPKTAGLWGAPTASKLSITPEERAQIFQTAERIDAVIREFIVTA